MENGRGLPRSFADDPFFQQHRSSPSAEFFRDFPPGQAGPTRRFGSNPRLFPEAERDPFFDDFGAPDFGTLPRRQASRSPRPPSAASERPVHVQRQCAPPVPPSPVQRQPSPQPRREEPSPARHSPKPSPQVHVINVHPPGPGKPTPEAGVVEINQAPSSYTNGKLNPDRAQAEASAPSPVPQASQPSQPVAESVAQPGPENGPADGMKDNSEERPKFSRKASINGCSDKLISLLDETELRVEKLREAANNLEQEKDALLDIINNLKLNTEILGLSEGDRDDITATTERILKRCKAVDVVVNTPRNEEQTRALEEVNALITVVTEKMAENLSSCKETISRFLNACSPDEPNGPIDQKFQTKIVECTADDQKKIRRRLAQMISQIDRAERTCLPQY